MPGAVTSEFDRWFVACEHAFASLCGHWRDEAGADSLLAWRLDRGLITPVSSVQVLGALTRPAPGDADATLVVSDLEDPALGDLIGKLPGHLRVLPWRAGPLAAVVEMNAPDRWLLASLQRHEVELAGTRPRPEPEARYVRALQNWESLARETAGEAFEQAYPVFARIPIPWSDLLIGARPEPIEDGWQAWRLPLLAAATRGEPFRIEAPLHSAERWTLSWAPVPGRTGGYLVFQSADASLAALLGRRVVVITATARFELGAVQADGFAEAAVEHDLDHGDMLVRIERPPGA